MEVQITILPSGFEIRSQYDKAYIDFYKSCPKAFFISERKVSSIPKTHYDEFLSYFKNHGCKLTIVDKSFTALVMYAKDTLIVKAEFDPSVGNIWRTTFPSAVYDDDDHEWELNKESFSEIKNFFNSRQIPFIYVNLQVQMFMDYIQHKVTKISARQKANPAYDVI